MGKDEQKVGADIANVVCEARERRASDIHVTVGSDIMFRVDGQLVPTPFSFSASKTEDLLLGLLDDAQRRVLEAGDDLDFAFVVGEGMRQRANIFRQRGALAATIRLLDNTIPAFDSLGLPPVLKQFVKERRGLVLVTGPTGSGKSTSLASMIELVNLTRPAHVVTIEDPVEYVYEAKRSLIHQREVGRDVATFAGALRSVLREDPDIVLVGEMRDYETIAAALTAAETGSLVLSTLHTTGVSQTVDRIIDACPLEAHEQIRTQFAGVLKGIVTQCLIPKACGEGRVVATELLVGTEAALNMIRESKEYQLVSVMQSGAAAGMHTLNSDLSRLVREGTITLEAAHDYAYDRKDLGEYL